MDRKEHARERQRQRRLDRLGTNTPSCSTCGEADDRCLEAHHVAGRRYDELTVVLCANCHRKVTDDQKDHPYPNPDGDVFLETIGHFLLGLADMLRLIVEKLVEFGEALIKRAETLEIHGSEARS